MKRFWTDVIEPIIRSIAPEHIVEIGADTGINTRHILDYCLKSDCRLTSIDPKPSYDIEDCRQQYGDKYNPVFEMSLDAIKDLDSCEIMLIDGDHNWFTVYHELIEVEKKMGDSFPLVMFHDTGWPYARRDMYYDPTNIPEGFVQENKQAGLLFGQNELCDSGGFNAHLHHAIETGTKRNGVLTGIEDFVKQSDNELSLVSYQGMNGLTLLYPSTRDDISDLLQSMDIPSRLSILLEKHRLIRSEVEMELQNSLKSATEENEQKTQEIVRLKTELRRKKNETIQLYELVETMRLKNRLKRLVLPASVRSGDLQLLLGSLKDDGLSSTIVKIKNRLREGGAGKKPEMGQGRAREIKVATQSSREIEVALASMVVTIPIVTPLVTIIILNRDGRIYLSRLFDNLEKYTVYPSVEVIVVDNASKDDSLGFLANLNCRFPVTILENNKNESYSKGHNQAIEQANGHYLVFLNNDIEPLNGWLCHLVHTAQTMPRVGSVGAQLIYPDSEVEPLSGLVQHSGIVFEYEHSDILDSDFLRPYNHGYGSNPLIGSYFPTEERIALTAACLLVNKSVYLKLGGLDEAYEYGYEDVDFCLRLFQSGLHNYYCPRSVLIHNESSTQKQQRSNEVKDRRIRNMRIFHDRWFDFLYQQYFSSKLISNTVNISAEKLHIAFAVTDIGREVAAGDYFTALELAGAFEKLGFITSFVTRRGGDWYDLNSDIDVLVSMLDAYDLDEITSRRKNIITVAWIRNWPNRWLSNPSLLDYDIILGSSSKLCEMVEQEIGKPVSLFPIACNPERFSRSKNHDARYSSDYAFTGNYWGKPRDIELALEPVRLDYKFSIYGKDWDKVKKFRDYHRGFIEYSDVPKVYANSKIVIDDAVAGITKPYGSVNSRVFDASAAGTLVLSSGSIGAKDLFGDLLPVWDNKEQLHNQLEHYLKNDKEREKLAIRIQKEILAKHTYDIRAKTFLNLIKSHIGLKKSIAIKLPIPSWDEAESWGDFHLGRGLKKYFERKGYFVLLQVLSEWDNSDGDACDVVIVLRGLSQYKTKTHQINYMWNISHPDKVTESEYNKYDRVFVASDIWAAHLRGVLEVPVETMHQCTDPEEFFPIEPEDQKKWHHEILFVGNSRKKYRKILKDLIPSKYDLSVYGGMWKGIIDEKYVKSEYLENHKLARYYGSADILLNDHWDSMRDYGFVSNRIFDGLASGAFIISDKVSGIDRLFPDSMLCTYESRQELHNALDKYMSNPELRGEIAGRGRDHVVRQHSFSNRVAQFVKSF